MSEPSSSSVYYFVPLNNNNIGMRKQNTNYPGNGKEFSGENCCIVFGKFFLVFNNTSTNHKPI